MINIGTVIITLSALLVNFSTSQDQSFNPGVEDKGFYVQGDSDAPIPTGKRNANNPVGREVRIVDITSFQHLLVSMGNGADLGMCRNLDDGGIRSVRTRASDADEWLDLGNYAVPDCEPGEEDVRLSENDIYSAAVRLLVHPGGPQLQPPPGSQALVNAPTIVFVDPEAQQVQATIAGIDVRIRATPRVFEWDFGDGSTPITTRDPGAPYPHQSVFYEYPKAGEYTITLSTAWEGEWSVAGSTWQPFTNYVITTSEVGTLNVRSMRARLVTGPEQ